MKNILYVYLKYVYKLNIYIFIMFLNFIMIVEFFSSLQQNELIIIVYLSFYIIYIYIFVLLSN
jgi:hypothetical protein